MPKTKEKIKLSENLKMGVSGPTSQGTFFKFGGVFFLILSLVLVFNIFNQLKKSPAFASNTNSDANQSQVLGAFSQNPNPNGQIQTAVYIVQTGDTLFNIAQSQNLNWQVIATLNNLKAPYTLKAGTKLKLPQ